MATIKMKFRASSIAAKEGVLFYQVIHRCVSRQIHTGHKIFSAEWDAIHSEVVAPLGTNESRQNYLLSLQNKVNEELSRLEEIILRLEYSDEEYSAGRVVELYRAQVDNSGFVLFTRNIIGQLNRIGKIRTAEAYTTTLNSFVRFLGVRDVLLGDICSNLMVEYETYLKSTGLCQNTTSYYMRNLRAIYNRAIDMELTMSRSPFKYVYTGIGKTVKRAVSINEIRQIRDLNLESNSSMDYARDLFMFSFYTRGMSFVDMAYLKKKDLKNGVLSYRRQKTNQQLFIKWEKPMQKIVDKYDAPKSPYLLPIIKDPQQDSRRQYKNAEHLVNVKLKKIGEQIGLSIPLTTYVARHGWASIARSKNVPISTISEAMGHDSEGTTRIYLASLDASVVDKANSIVLKSI